MGLPRLGGLGGNGGDVWVVGAKNLTLKKIKDKCPHKRFVGGAGANSRFVSTNTTINQNICWSLLAIIHRSLTSVDDLRLSEILRHVDNRY